MAGFTEIDPATGSVRVGVNRSVLVLDAAGKQVKTLVGKDLASDAAFDAATGRAYVARQDGGDLSDPANDNNGTLTVYDTEDFAVAAKELSLPGNHSQSGAASLAVEPGGATVFVTSPAEGKTTKLVRQVSPLVTRAPADLAAVDGEEVTIAAAAEGSPGPTVRWQVSTDSSQTWKDVEGATGSAPHVHREDGAGRLPLPRRVPQRRRHHPHLRRDTHRHRGHGRRGDGRRQWRR